MAARRNQRDIIRELYANFREDQQHIYAEVERAVERGEFRRGRNAANQSLLRYVRFLIDDGRRKGWIYKSSIDKATPTHSPVVIA
jgi:hypothetical protein